jgi:hypothetical protein
MTPEFPWYVTSEADKAEMAYWCPAELDAWRIAKARHLAARDAGGTRWAPLAVAYSTLRTAYLAAINQPAAA